MRPTGEGITLFPHHNGAHGAPATVEEFEEGVVGGGDGDVDSVATALLKAYISVALSSGRSIG